MSLNTDPLGSIVISAHAFLAFRACDGYLYCAQMEQAQNSDSETHVEKLDWTSRTDLSRKSRSCIFSNFRALLILNGYLYCAQMEWAQNSDSETHVENKNQTSRTD